jgi:hypothetical protein
MIRKFNELNLHDEESKGENIRAPEHSLLSSILHRALLDLVQSDRKIANCAYKWCTRKNNYGLVPFEYCCEHLDIDAKMLRKKIKKLHLFLNDTKSPKNVIDIEMFSVRLKNHSRKTT